MSQGNPDVPSAVRDNIASVTEMESTLEHRRSLVDRIADLIGGFSGSMTFVFLHLVWFLAWFSSTQALSGASRGSIPIPSSCSP